MSYTKLEVHYTTVVACLTREGEKMKTITLPKKVVEYGDKYGYSSISIDYKLDHIVLKGGSTILMDVDINGSDNKYIGAIVSTKWK